MKLRILNIFASLFVTASIITSCLDSDEIEYKPSQNAVITSFAIKDSIITHYNAQVNGKDTMLSTSVIGSEYPFIIDQYESRIYNPDSLPVGTDISKVVVEIGIDGFHVVIEAEQDSVWQEEDSLSFEKPIKFKVLSLANVYGRTYTAQINVHQQKPEEMGWQKMEGNFPNIQAQKAVLSNGNIYVFAEQEDQVAMTKTSINDGKNWTSLQTLDIPNKADYSSAMVWNNSFYILADNKLYTSTDALNWNMVETEQTVSRLLACTDTEKSKKLIAADMENHFIETEDGINWNQYDVLPEGFPKAQSSFTSYTLDTNEDINRIVLLERNEEKTDSLTSAWMMLDTDNEWVDLACENKDYACPVLENAAIIRYNNKLYTFGGPGQRNTSFQAFSKFFQSEDNGISWKTVDENIVFPETFNELYESAHGDFSYIVDENHFIWIMWGTIGEVWRGRINKLGFERQ